MLWRSIFRKDIHISRKVKIYAQCYAAIANRMGDMDRLRCVDLGSWTLDVLSVRDKIPIDSGQYEEKYPNVRRIELRVSFLFEEPKLCHRLLEKAKHVFMNVFENVEMIVENGEIKEGEIYGQGSF